MTTEKNQSLGEYVRTRRESLQLNYYEASNLAGLNHTFWRKLEAGQYQAPSPRSLEAIAKVIEVPIEDLYALAGYDLPAGLPSFSPYLRARYHLPHDAVVEMERYFDLLRSYYDIPADKSVFPPKPKQRKSTGRPAPRPKRRAA